MTLTQFPVPRTSKVPSVLYLHSIAFPFKQTSFTPCAQVHSVQNRYTRNFFLVWLSCPTQTRASSFTRFL